MASSIIITIKSSRTSVDSTSRLKKSSSQNGAKALEQYFKSLAGGLELASVDLSVGSQAPVAASGTITLASVSADDTVTIGKVVLTAKAAPVGEDQWSQAGTDAVDATSLVNCINAHSVLSKLVRASSVGAVVTVVCLTKGSIGNQVGLASSNGTRLAVTGSGYLANGTGGAESLVSSYSLGL